MANRIESYLSLYRPRLVIIMAGVNNQWSLNENAAVDEIPGADGRYLAKLRTADGLRTVRVCARENIKTNVTLVFSAPQALLAAKAGATYVSPFVGRLDDVSVVGMDLIAQIVQILANYEYETEIIVASIRNPLHFVDAATYGAHIATVPYNVLEQLLKHPLTDIGIQKFLNDWEKVPK